MAIGTYSELQTAVANWLTRADLTSRIPEAIAMAEAEFNDTLRHRNMEQRATATATEYMSLPSDFQELRTIKIQGSPSIKLQPFSSHVGEYTTTDTPRYFQLTANQIRLIPSPAGTETVEIDYWKQIPALSAANTTNWLLTAAPYLYLYQACFHALTLVQDDARAAAAQALAQTYLGRLNGSSNRDRWGGGSLQTRPDARA